MNPTASEILSRIAADSPWFPSGSNAEVESVIAKLWQAKLIVAADWVKGKGQGFALTPEGRQAHDNPSLLPRLLAGEAIEPTVPVTGPTTYDRGERARRAYYEPVRPVVTPVLVVLNLAVFIVGLIIAWRVGSGRMAYLDGKDVPTLVKLGAVSGDRLVAGEWWRLGSANFVHIGIIHLLLNVYCLALVGSLAENLWGRWRFALIYLVAGLAGCSLAMELKPASLVAGASCATWGVMTSLAVWLVQYRQHFEKDIVSDFGRRLALAIGLNAAFSLLPHVSWQGHLGGAIGGALMAIALDWIRRGYPRRTKAGILAAILLPIAILGGLLFVASRSEAWRPLIASEAKYHQNLFLKEFEPELMSIGPRTIELLHGETLQAARRGNVTRFPKFEQRAREIQTHAHSISERAGSAVTNRYTQEMPQKLRAYCEAVKNYSQKMLDYYLVDGTELKSAATALVIVEEKWIDLFHNRWMDP